MRQFIPLAAAAALALPAVARAADETPVALQAKPATSDVHIDTTIPENPGFAVIALSPSKVIDPSALRIASLNLSQFVDDDGKAKDGLAFAFAPYFWANRRESLERYQDKIRHDWLLRALSLTTVSIGYVRKQDGKPERLGIGFASELFGKTKGPDGDLYADYRLDEGLRSCISDAYLKWVDPNLATNADPVLQVAKEEWKEAVKAGVVAGIPTHLPPLGKPVPERIQADPVAFEDVWIQARRDTLQEARLAADRAKAVSPEMANAVAACRSSALDRHNQRDSLVLAGGIALKPNPRPGEDNIDGGSVWGSYRHRGIVEGNYFTAFVREDFDRQAEVPAGFQGFDKFSAALLLGYERKLPEGGKADLARVSVEGGYERLNYHGKGPLKDDDTAYYAVTAAFRVLENTYVEVKAGQGSLETGGKGKADKVTFAIRRSLQ